MVLCTKVESLELLLVEDPGCRERSDRSGGSQVLGEQDESLVQAMEELKELESFSIAGFEREDLRWYHWPDMSRSTFNR